MPGPDFTFTRTREVDYEFTPGGRFEPSSDPAIAATIMALSAHFGHLVSGVAFFSFPLPAERSSSWLTATIRLSGENDRFGRPIFVLTGNILPFENGRGWIDFALPAGDSKPENSVGFEDDPFFQAPDLHFFKGHYLAEPEKFSWFLRLLAESDKPLAWAWGGMHPGMDTTGIKFDVRCICGDTLPKGLSAPQLPEQPKPKPKECIRNFKGFHAGPEWISYSPLPAKRKYWPTAGGADMSGGSAIERKEENQTGLLARFVKRFLTFEKRLDPWRELALAILDYASPGKKQLDNREVDYKLLHNLGKKQNIDLSSLDTEQENTLLLLAALTPVLTESKQFRIRKAAKDLSLRKLRAMLYEIEDNEKRSRPLQL